MNYRAMQLLRGRLKDMGREIEWAIERAERDAASSEHDEDTLPSAFDEDTLDARAETLFDRDLERETAGGGKVDLYRVDGVTYFTAESKMNIASVSGISDDDLLWIIDRAKYLLDN